MTLVRAIGVWCCGSLLVFSCKYATPEAETGAPQEEPLRAEKQGTPASEEEAGPPTQRDTPEAAKRAPVEASGACDDRSCTANEECCKSYLCGFDPERSKVQRYCLPQ